MLPKTEWKTIHFQWCVALITVCISVFFSLLCAVKLCNAWPTLKEKKNNELTKQARRDVKTRFDPWMNLCFWSAFFPVRNYFVFCCVFFPFFFSWLKLQILHFREVSSHTMIWSFLFFLLVIGMPTQHLGLLFSSCDSVELPKLNTIAFVTLVGINVEWISWFQAQTAGHHKTFAPQAVCQNNILKFLTVRKI